MSEQTKQKVTDENHQITQNIFSGLSFKGKPVSKEEYVLHYEEYVKRCNS